MMLARAAFLAAALLAVAGASPSPETGEGSGKAKLALTVEIDGAIGPASARYLKEALAEAAERHAEIVILRLNTPGGLVTSTREMIADIIASPVPIVGYVAPSGGHAASAGTYILYATHVAAMAPGTNIGAATPVELGGPLPSLPGDETRDKDSGEGKDQKSPTAPQSSEDAMTAKVTNDAVAFIRSLAELRERNADWAEKAVREAATLSANAALEAHVIDLVARDTTELLQLTDGRTVDVAGSKRTLATKGLPVETLKPGWLIELLSIITDPNIAVILMLIGVYGIVFEFSSPRRHRSRRDRNGLPVARALCPQFAADRLCRPRPDAARHWFSGYRGFQPDGGAWARGCHRFSSWRSHAAQGRGSRLSDVLDRHRQRGRIDPRPGAVDGQLSLGSPQKSPTRRRTSHARSAGRNPRLVGR